MIIPQKITSDRRETANPPAHCPICVVSGASGSGKTTALLKLDQTTIESSRITVMSSLTTRPPREAEEPFRISVSEEAFDVYSAEMIQMIRFGSHRYGILAADVRAGLANGYVLVDCIAEGILQLRQHYPVKAAFLYTRPQVLLQRLLDRKATEADIRFRMNESANQLRKALGCGLYSLFIDTASELDETLQELKDFLVGDPAKSDPPDYNEYLEELQNVMNAWDSEGGYMNV